MEAVRLENVYYRYPSSTSWVLKDLTLDIGRGRVLIAGDTGSGKSTLLRVIAGIAVKIYGGELRGQVIVNGKPVLVPQNFDAFSLMPTPRLELEYVLENRSIPEGEINEIVQRIASTLGIDGILDKPVHNLSMGERQRIAIASALALKPDILLLDEPFAYIDPPSVSRILETASRMADTIIIAEHRIRYLIGWVDEVIVLRDGGLAFKGNPRDFLEWSDMPLHYRVQVTDIHEPGSIPRECMG